MRTERASFWTGVGLGVVTGAAAVYAGLKVWADHWPLPGEGFTVGGSGHQDHVHGLFGEKYLADGDLAEIRRRKWNEDHPDPMFQRPEFPVPPVAEEYLVPLPCMRRSDHVAHGYPPDLPRSGDHYCPGVPRPEPEVWCPGVNDIHPTSLEPKGPVRWEQCTATIRHTIHRRYDRGLGYLFHAPVDPGDPEKRELHGEPEWICLGSTDEGFSISASVEEVRASFDQEPDADDFPDDTSGAGEDSQAPDGWVHGERYDGASCNHAGSTPCPLGMSLTEHHHDSGECANNGQPHDGPCLTAIYYPSTVKVAEDMARIREDFRRAAAPLANLGPELRRVFAPLTAAPSVKCYRSWPHPEHSVPSIGAHCPGIRKATDGG